MRAHRLRPTLLIVVAIHLLVGWILTGMPATRSRDATVPRRGVRWLDTGRPRPIAARELVANTPAAAPFSPPERAAKPGRPEAMAKLAALASPAATPPSRTRPSARPARIPTTAPRVRRGEALATAPATRDIPPWPIYPTRAPPSTLLRYTVVQGGGKTPGAIGDARLEWHGDGSAFDLRLVVAMPGRPPREWESAGGFDAAGLAPARLAERERGHDKRAVNFDQVARQVRFSGAVQALALAAGAQDRWSWVAQLAAIAEAAARAPISSGTEWTIQVAGLRGDLDRWTFRVLPDDVPPEIGLPDCQSGGNDALSPPARASPLLHVVREPERPYDLRIEAWLSPFLHHLPIGLRMSTPPGSWSLALWQRAADADPQAGNASAGAARPDATALAGVGIP